MLDIWREKILNSGAMVNGCLKRNNYWVAKRKGKHVSLMKVSEDLE